MKSPSFKCYDQVLYRYHRPNQVVRGIVLQASPILGRIIVKMQDGTVIAGSIKSFQATKF